MMISFIKETAIQFNISLSKLYKPVKSKVAAFSRESFKAGVPKNFNLAGQNQPKSDLDLGPKCNIKKNTHTISKVY